jgi:hypothetical protein
MEQQFKLGPDPLPHLPVEKRLPHTGRAGNWMLQEQRREKLSLRREKRNSQPSPALDSWRRDKGLGKPHS